MTSPLVAAVFSSQKRRRWKAYVGSSTRDIPVSAKAGLQSTSTPCTHSSASEVRNRSRPPASRRRVLTATGAVRSGLSSVSRIPMARTGCGLTSMNVPYPRSPSASTVDRKRTGWRRFRYQYPASSSAVSSGPAVTVE